MKCSINSDNMRLAGLILLLQTICPQNKRNSFFEILIFVFVLFREMDVN